MPVLSTSRNLTIWGVGSIIAALGTAAVEYATGGFGAVSWGAVLATIVAAVTAIMSKGAKSTNAPNPLPSAQVVPPAP